MYIVCSDLEGVFTPEVWINVAERTGIEELKLTTRDIPDYDVLMKKRLAILDDKGLKLKDITDVIETMEPLEGAREFLDWLRTQVQVLILSDTYTEFAKPLIRKLGWPTLFCHDLTLDASGAISDYNLRIREMKRETVQAMKQLNYETIAMGDSYNDISMLKEADQGILFRPPENVVKEFPEFPVTHAYEELRTTLEGILGT